MRTKNLFLAATLLVGLPLVVVAQESSSAQDEAAIRQTVQDYFDAMTTNDAAGFKKAVHPGAKWFNAADKGRLWEISQQRIAANLQRNARSHLPQVQATMKIVAIDIAAGVASAKIETEYLTNAPPELMPKLAGKGSRFAEYLSLIKFDDGWKIVSRVYSGERIPAMSQMRPSLRK